MREVSKVSSADLPSISIVIPTYNSEKIIDDCLKSIINQNYPKNKIEIIVVDGGSKDKTIQIAKLYGATVLLEATGRPEAATAIGYKEAKGDLILNLPTDNIIPYNNWLKDMIKPFQKCPEIVAAQTLRYFYGKNLSLLDRYFALFGAGDPLAFYLNKRDRISWMEEDGVPFAEFKDMGAFYIVKMNPQNIPTLGANGYIVRRRIIQKFIGNTLNFFHIDSNVDMIKNGYNKYAIVKTTIIHRSGERFFTYFRKRIRYMLIYFKDRSRRRYHLYDPMNDKLKLAKFVFFSLTFIKTTYDAVRGYKKIKDVAWFLHPIICWGTTILYAITTVVQLLSRNVHNDIL
ncbi:MAG: glycosyltransferase family A protein [Nitrososphaeria archaeon]|uniref:glycosyltransferase n=1 Tax=Saccharolobus sp. TaxID=2100761 RepID=UPI003164EB0A